MKPQHDPLRLEMVAFATEGGQLAGHWPGASLRRLAESQSPPHDGALPDVAWSAQGERLPAAGGVSQWWLSLSAQAPVWLTCQRCLQPFELPLAFERRLRFVHGEAEAETLDAESDDDVLALGRSLDLRELVEDELLLALPIVPRHEVCLQPLPMAVGEQALKDDVPERPHPFAALQALKSGKGTGGKG